MSRGGRVGVLAVQGAVQAHARVLTSLGAGVHPVRHPSDLNDLDALVLPGGESTTISLLLERNELHEALAEVLAGGLPVLGTCAGMILASVDVLDGRSDQRSLGLIDISVRRNAFGRQQSSFETSLDVRGVQGGAVPAVFIRAPWVERTGPGVDVLARVDGVAVACSQGNVTVTSFHPELSGDDRLHRAWLDGALDGNGPRWDS